jgi:hypothetical protein
MNQQMTLLEARAVAREREHRLRPTLRSTATWRRRLGRRLTLASLGRHRPVRTTSGRPSGVAAARG